MLTEAEAKTKFCPLSRVSAGASDMVGNVAVNRWDDGNIATGCHCLGSVCMAWRWVEQRDRVEYEYQEMGKIKGELNPPFSNCPDGFEVTSHGWDTFHCRRETSRLPPRGYCGAFGRQEE